MKTNLLFVVCLLAISVVTSLRAATPEQEKAFVDKYKTAFEAGDKATLEPFLYTKNAHPMALEFYKMMQTNNAGEKIASIELVDLTAEGIKKAGEVMAGPDGSKSKLPLKPIKKLKIKTESKEGSSESESFVAEADGKLVIPVPVAVK